MVLFLMTYGKPLPTLLLQNNIPKLIPRIFLYSWRKTESKGKTLKEGEPQ